MFFHNTMTECYSPVETAPSQNYCYDSNGKSDAECVCTDAATAECYEFVPGTGSSGTCDPAEATTDLLIAAIGAAVCFFACLTMWFLVACFGPIYGRNYGFYYLIFDRAQLKKSLQEKTNVIKDNTSLALKEYNKKKKAAKAKGGFEELVSKLNKEASERGGTLGLFKVFDQSSRGALSDLEFRAGLQELHIKAAAADVSKLWEFMDTDHGGNITFADFAAGLKAATKSEAQDLEAGGGAMNEEAEHAWAKVHLLMDRMGLSASDFFVQKLDVNSTEDLDQADFEESLTNIGLVLLDEEVQALWESTVVPPNDMINAEDFQRACDKFTS
jgi:Ca2+-binding EF-hand superfamily protein